LALDDLKINQKFTESHYLSLFVFQQHPVLGVMVLSGCSNSCQLLYFTLHLHFSWPRK